LDRRDDLFKLDALEQRVQEFRQIYTSPTLHHWIENVLPTMTSSWSIQLSPLEQVVDLAETFCAGERLVYGTQFKPLTHITDGIRNEDKEARSLSWLCQRDYEALPRRTRLG
jgi:hypothetical protein